MDGVEEDGESEQLVVCAIGSGGQPFLEEGPGNTGMSQSCLLRLEVG